MKTKAYAKINLTLDVFEKTDGLHLLDTVIAPVDLSDDVEVNFFEDKGVTCTMDGVLQDETNSAVKAAKIMIEEYDLPGVDVTIQKGIPLSAGLGGSTADGVAVFRIYSDVFGVKVTRSMLKKLGSDAAAMWQNRICRAEGTGGIVTPVKIEVPYKIGLVVAEGGVSTAECYAAFDENPGKRRRFTENLLAKKVFDVRALGNDLEDAATALNPNIKEAINRLYLAGAKKAVMTGSGSGVVGYFEKDAYLSEDITELKILY